MCVRVGIGLGDVLALEVEPLEGAVDRLVHHVGDAQAGRAAELDAPQALEHLARRVVGDMAIAGEFVRERAHVARALHVVLAAQRVHADALAADIAGRHGEIGDRHDRRRALRMLGDAEAVIDRGVAAGRVEPRRLAHGLRIDAGRLPPTASGECAVLGDEARPGLEIGGIAALGDEGLVDEPLGDDDMRERIEDGDVRARPQRQVIVRLDMRAAHEVDAARIDRRSAGAPARRRFLRREANTGWASVGLAPITMTTSALSTDLKSCVPADVPKAFERP